jgi:hypothetical protein
LIHAVNHVRIKDSSRPPLRFYYCAPTAIPSVLTQPGPITDLAGTRTKPPGWVENSTTPRLASRDASGPRKRTFAQTPSDSRIRRSGSRHRPRLTSKWAFRVLLLDQPSGAFLRLGIKPEGADLSVRSLAAAGWRVSAPKTLIPCPVGSPQRCCRHEDRPPS